LIASDFFNSDVLQILISPVIEFRQAGAVLPEATWVLVRITGRNTDHHAGSGAGEQYAVCILAADEEKRRTLALQMEKEVFSKLDLSAFGLESPKKSTRK
jgi:hypothetical protein